MPQDRTNPPQDPQPELQALIAALYREIHPGKSMAIGPGTSLDRDLGFDSLTRMELLLRIERSFGVRLAEARFMEAATVADLAATLRQAAPGLAAVAAEPMPIAASGGAGVAPLPADIATLNEALRWQARHHGERIHAIHLNGDGGETVIRYGELWADAQAVARGLQSRGLTPGDAVAMMLPTCPEFFPCFMGILLAGAVPVPIYPPARASQIEDHLRRNAAILANAGARLLITTTEAKLAARLLLGLVPSLAAVLRPEELACPGAEVLCPVAAEAIALLQYTSGSTGQPKGVVLSHANLLANIRAMATVAEADSADVFVSWLPLYHDMGLIGSWLTSLCLGIRFVVMSPLAFLAHPERWLWAIHRHRGTLSGAPNFAFELCLRRIDDAALAGLDLSSWRIAFNGAEAVSADTMRRFAARFAPWGLRPEALAPVYGLAESAVDLTLSPGRGLLTDRIGRDLFLSQGLALPAAPGDAEAMEFVACGRPLPGHELRIVDAGGAPLAERQEGRLQFRGPSATRGYYRNPEASQRLIRGDWLESGDRAYLADGEVYLTGRDKDIIIKDGRNLHPQEIEEAVSDIPGIRRGCVAAFGSPDPQTGSERLVIVAETRESDPAAQARLRREIVARSVDVLGVPPDQVELSSRRIVLKTSSGKVRRAASRQLFEQGGVAAPRAAWLQVLRLAAASLVPLLRRACTGAAELAHGLRAAGCFLLLTPPTWLVASLLPRPAWSWNFCRAMARLFLALAGIRWRLAMAQPPAEGAVVLVPNHGSYLDGLLLVAALPWRGQQFAAKRELTASAIAGPFLRALGSVFVERFDLRQGAADAEILMDKARGGASPIIFAEGTFSRAAGLRPFRLGAFVVAASTGLPVVPVAIRGARQVLPDGIWLPRRGEIVVTLCPSLRAAGSDWAAALELRDRTRAALAAHCGEPDLQPPA